MAIWKKRLILLVGVLFIAAVVTLAFTPHYGCACGQDEGIYKPNGSMLTHIVKWLFSF